MGALIQSEQRLQQAYEILRDLFEQSEDRVEETSHIAYLPVLPPVDPGSRLSATDLLSSWFRPPTGHDDPWKNFFNKFEPHSSSASTTTPAAASVHVHTPKALLKALFPEQEEDLSNEDADSAIEVLYDFLHALGRHEVETAMTFVADDYHSFEDDREIDRNDLRNMLDALLESLEGWSFDISLSTVPEPLRHPYGIIVYAEIQIDAVQPGTNAKRNIVDRRLVLLQVQSNSIWRLSALSPVHLENL